MIGQMNFAIARAPLDHPSMADFTNNLARINQLAEQSVGFVWRLQDETGNATSIKIMTDPKAILNVSVWQSVADLHAFAFHSEHKLFVRRRDEWFVPSAFQSAAIWNMEEGDKMPTPEQAFERLRHLQTHGPSGFAFDFKTAKLYA